MAYPILFCCGASGPTVLYRTAVYGSRVIKIRKNRLSERDACAHTSADNTLVASQIATATTCDASASDDFPIGLLCDCLLVGRVEAEAGLELSRRQDIMQGLPRQFKTPESPSGEISVGLMMPEQQTRLLVVVRRKPGLLIL